MQTLSFSFSQTTILNEKWNTGKGVQLQSKTLLPRIKLNWGFSTTKRIPASCAHLTDDQVCLTMKFETSLILADLAHAAQGLHDLFSLRECRARDAEPHGGAKNTPTTKGLLNHFHRRSSSSVRSTVTKGQMHYVAPIASGNR